MRFILVSLETINGAKDCILALHHGGNEAEHNAKMLRSAGHRVEVMSLDDQREITLDLPVKLRQEALDRDGGVLRCPHCGAVKEKP